MPDPVHPNRRKLLALGTTAAAMAALAPAAALGESRPAAAPRPFFSLTGTRLRVFHPALRRRVRVMVIADTHLQRDDDRGDPYRQYSARMARAYLRTIHHATGEATNPEESFVRSVEEAKTRRADLILLAGDILSFPSEAGVEWVLGVVKKSGIPFLFTAGNHDWHYEGTEGSVVELRETWIKNRLLPLYQGEHPLMHSREVKDVRFLSIDNSTYEILPPQLEFFRKEAAAGKPLVLMMHIPLYMTGRSVGYGCGHPEWGAATDRHHRLERRPRWPESGHTETTLAFRREVLACPHILAMFAGHVHRAALDLAGTFPQFVAEANYRGGHLDVAFDPPPGGG